VLKLEFWHLNLAEKSARLKLGWGFEKLTGLWLGESHFYLIERLCLLLGGLPTCAFLVDHPFAALLMDVEHTISLLWFGIYAL
jgi:hypothetical protein